MTLSQVRTQMTTEELCGWNAYFCFRADEEQKAYDKAKRRR
jgi:hypothetical protein